MTKNRVTSDVKLGRVFDCQSRLLAAVAEADAQLKEVREQLNAALDRVNSALETGDYVAASEAALAVVNVHASHEMYRAACVCYYAAQDLRTAKGAWELVG